ncbi:MAG: hypothetical protein IJ804_09280 [Prevotella sp.]|nr:hypothetical protein [Prevotella sp.]
MRHFFRKSLTFLAFLLMAHGVALSQSSIIAKVYRQDGTNKAYYGKMHIPQGGKYRISMNPTASSTVGVFRAYIDGQYIYLSAVDTYGHTYWIDATDCDHNFLVRSNDGSDVVAEPVTAAEDAAMDDNGYFYFDSGDARKNQLRFATAAVPNAMLRTSSTYKDRPVYVMANPARRGLSFAWLDQDATTLDLPQGALYILGKAGSKGRLMNIVFEDDFDEATAINSTRTDATPVSDDACYTLQGVRVAEPQKGTLYIRNGKKYVAE